MPKDKSGPTTRRNPTYLMIKKRGKFRRPRLVNKGPQVALSKTASTDHDLYEQTTPQDKAYHNDHISPTDANRPTSAEGPEHVQDKIKTLLKRATALAATDNETYAHLKELHDINEEVKLVEQHLQDVQSQLATPSPQEGDQ